MVNPVFRPASEWPVIDEVDVLVAGAGPAGVAAAVAAARLEARTLIIEKHGYAGGAATASNCPHIMGFGGETQTVKGIADELIRLLDGMGQARLRTPPAMTIDPAPIGGRPLTNVVVSVEGMRVGCNRLLDRAGARRLFYAPLIGAVTQGRRVTAVAVDRVDGPGLIKAKAFVDATGDANLVWRAGGGTRTYPVEDSMTKTILIRVGGVKGYNRPALEQAFRLELEAGRVPFAGQDRYMGTALLNPGEALLNITLVAGNGVEAADLTRMDGVLREQALAAVAWYRTWAPGFGDCYLVDAACEVGVRAGRGIVGVETITTRDLDEGAPVPEPVAVGSRGYGGHGLSGFLETWARNNPGNRGVPWRTLLSADLDNVAAAGRAISCEARAISCMRLMARCMATGQAAGVTAALASRQGKTMAETGYAAVRQALLAGGAALE